MRPRAGSWIWPIVVGVGGLGCEMQDGELPTVDVAPTAASPGETVRLVADQSSLLDAAQTTVLIGDQPSTIVRAISGTELEVIVPPVAPGVTSVVVRAGGQDVATGNLDILAPVAVGLVLSFENDKVALVSTSATGGGWWESGKSGGRRLSFDVLSAQGGLVFTGAINHPTLGRLEVFEDPGPGLMRGAPQPRSATFAIKIPNVAGAKTVRFFDVEPGVDLGTPEGREARTFLNDVVVND